MSNPLLEPIHGVSLRDYAAMCARVAAGVDEAEVCGAFGIEQAVFQEVNTLWIARMREDDTFEVTALFGQYFGEADSHPKLGGLKPAMDEEGAANLEKMKTDRYFFEELNGAREAAYDYGYDGAEWILNNFGINLGDFQSVAMKWMAVRNSENADTIGHYLDYRNEKKGEYAEKFAAEQGGNIADDVEF